MKKKKKKENRQQFPFKFHCRITHLFFRISKPRRLEYEIITVYSKFESANPPESHTFSVRLFYVFFFSTSINPRVNVNYKILPVLFVPIHKRTTSISGNVVILILLEITERFNKTRVLTEQPLRRWPKNEANSPLSFFKDDNRTLMFAKTIVTGIYNTAGRILSDYFNSCPHGIP